MRFRSVIAAAAVPAVIGSALLLSTAANAAPLPQSAVTAVTHEHAAADTTNITGNATVSTANGPAWAYDNLTRKVTATDNGDGTWNVRVDSQGSFSAFASPLDGNAWAGAGSVKGWVTYLVTSTGTPDPANIRGNLPDGTTSTQLLRQFFGDPAAQAAGLHYRFDYNPVTVPADNAVLYEGYQGIYFGMGPDGLHYTQAG
jgi:hypothetical protein